MQTHIDYPGLINLLDNAAHAGRNCLFEQEVYQFIQLIGGETPPQFYFHGSGRRHCTLNPSPPYPAGRIGQGQHLQF